ncbi:MAG: SpoIID/LytB domain-containing protein [Halanaerobiales bacterium]|nr:SpoIID/LytB domain-containing protein [Halanaerobiales bacterium]
MLRQRRRIGYFLLLNLLIMACVMGNQVKGYFFQPFTRDVENLIILKILPEKDWNPKEYIINLQYVTFAKRLVNGQGEGALSFDFAGESPDDFIIYKDALAYASQIFEIEDTKIKEITEELEKSDFDKLNGYEMAYIFNSILYAKVDGSNNSILLEKFMLGNNEWISSRIMKITKDYIIFEDEGRFQLAQDVRAFLKEGDLIKPIGIGQIAVGMKDLKLLFNVEGKVQTVILPEFRYPEKIRVVISKELDNLGNSLSHDFSEIKIRADQLYKLTIREKGKYRVLMLAEEGEIITFTNQGGRIKITADDGSIFVDERIYLQSFYPHECRYEVLSTVRHDKNPVYAGEMEVTLSDNREDLHLINELAIETYLENVVPSEIPGSWGLESFKVQAIVARSYAISQIANSKFEYKSANVDDSVTSQVYNNCSPNKLVNKAIAETTGIVPLYNGKVIDAVFYSTSAGYSANNEDVWHSLRTKDFPGNPIPYLRAKSQIIDSSINRFIDETKALAFFKDQTIKSFDEISPYYRWKIELTREELENTINKNLPERETADKILGANFIETLEGQPVVSGDSEFSIGKLIDLGVVQRGEGGNIMTLEIVGTNGTYHINKEFNVRFVIRPSKEMTGSDRDLILECYDGSIYRNYSILPSAFAAFDIQRTEQGDIEKVIIYGGGNGHGVGMSQWGMKGMVEQGYTYEEILKHYYTDIELSKY